MRPHESGSAGAEPPGPVCGGAGAPRLDYVLRFRRLRRLRHRRRRRLFLKRRQPRPDRLSLFWAVEKLAGTTAPKALMSLPPCLWFAVPVLLQDDPFCRGTLPSHSKTAIRGP